MQMMYVCILCASCGSSECCLLHDLQFVNAGRMQEAIIWKKHTSEPVLWVAMSVSFCLPHPVAVSVF